MSKEYAGDNAIRPLEKLMNDFCRSKGYDTNQVFTDFLDYLIWLFNPAGGKIDGWKYSSDESKKFFEMAGTYLKIMAQQTQELGWYDAFGDLFMALHPSGNGKGQFFTPPSVCNMVAACNMRGANLEEYETRTPFGKRICINDPAAGSSRLILAGNKVLLEMMKNDLHYDDIKIAANRPYLVAEDLDYNCVKMSAINIMVHGCFGEAVCHDTLCEPEAVRAGYIINESMWPFPTNVPSIRMEMRPERFVCTSRMIAIRKAKEAQKEAPPPPDKQEPPKPEPTEATMRKRKEYKQLELW